MMINVTKLDAEIRRAGIAISGCDTNGIVFDEQGSQIQKRADVAAIIAAHDPNPSADELAALARKLGAKAIAQSVNGWFTWDISQMSTWVQDNIGTPLVNGRANLPVSITLTNIRPILVAFLDILDKILVMMIALAKMEIALRDDKWPEQNNPTIK